MNRAGYFTAHSAEGIHWELDSPDPLWPSADVITAAWDPVLGCARIAMKRNRWARGMFRRAFDMAEWTREAATDPHSALIPDEFDDLNARTRGFTAADYYGVGLMPTAGPTFGFLWNFRHQSPLGSWRHICFGQTGCMELSILYQSEPRGCWQHVPGRPAWFGVDDAPEWARGALVTASSPLDVGDRTRLYFTGTGDRHGWLGDSRGDCVSEWKAGRLNGGFARIGLLTWRRNRILGLASEGDASFFLTPRRSTGQEGGLVLNLATRGGGAVRAAILDPRTRKPLPGFKLEDCRPVCGDRLRVRMRWPRQTRMPPYGKRPPLAQIEADRATVYAFDYALSAS